jgi:hypothetical protein
MTLSLHLDAMDEGPSLHRPAMGQSKRSVLVSPFACLGVDEVGDPKANASEGRGTEEALGGMAESSADLDKAPCIACTTS